ncbi:hypothetical protein JOF29_007326 [Kribbella aluminosa]|uniref:ImmA/IrrE family metallo-endopeptidase n=1 Tax=Kribbella aluminosa TaxID=416017 RepID=A0ABS4UXF9_9ACTN|nr:hypothetical protein [Kribbella aluminosa]MBP2356216.1 hypothetical protein [Kribbella aluminosa]
MIRPVPNVELSQTQLGGLMERPRVTPEDLRDALHSEIRKRSSGVEWVRWLDASVALRNYSFRNVVLITLQMPYASQVARSDIWQKLGRSIQNSQQDREIRVLAPVILQRGRRLTLETSQPDLELERARQARGGGRLVGFKVASVWDISQTDGPVLPQPAAPSGGGASTGELWRALEHEVRSAGYTLVETNVGDASLEGFTNFQKRTVVIRSDLDEVTAVARLAHEVAHLRMHDAKEIAAPETVVCRGMKEIEAESVSYLLMAHHGWSTGGSSFRYIASWAAQVNKREPEKVIERTGARVVLVARRLIGTVDRQLHRGGLSHRRPELRSLSLGTLPSRHETAERPFDGPEL